MKLPKVGLVGLNGMRGIAVQRGTSSRNVLDLRVGCRKGVERQRRWGELEKLLEQLLYFAPVDYLTNDAYRLL